MHHTVCVPKYNSAGSYVMLLIMFPFCTCTLVFVQNHCCLTHHIMSVTKAPGVLKNSPVFCLFHFLSNIFRGQWAEKVKSTNGRERLGVESFRYICEDQTTGPLRGPLGCCESLQRRWRSEMKLLAIKITCWLQYWDIMSITMFVSKCLRILCK